MTTQLTSNRTPRNHDSPCPTKENGANQLAGGTQGSTWLHHPGPRGRFGRFSTAVRASLLGLASVLGLAGAAPAGATM